MHRVPPRRLSSITIANVERDSGGLFLYCALHRCWHDRSSFSPGSTGQQKKATRYCLNATWSEKQQFDEIADMEPSDEGRYDIANKLGIRVEGAPTAAPSERATRMASRGDGGGSSSADAGATASRPPRKVLKQRPRTRASAAKANTKSRPLSENARLNKIWTSRAGRVFAKNYSKRVRGCGTAVDLPLCRRMGDLERHLSTLRADGVLRRAR